MSPIGDTCFLDGIKATSALEAETIDIQMSILSGNRKAWVYLDLMFQFLDGEHVVLFIEGGEPTPTILLEDTVYVQI
jgi:hypothetical protein